MAVLKFLALMYIAYMFLRVLRAVPLVARRSTRPSSGKFSPYDVYQKAFFAAFQQAARQRQAASNGSDMPPHQSSGFHGAPPPKEPPPLTPWAILDVAHGSTPEQIRRAYQSRVRLYHPDRLVDLAPELRELAERRTKEINEAYATLKRYHVPQS